MPTYELTCQGCGVPFTAKSPRAKWHAPGCKKRVQRNPPAVEPDVDEPDPTWVDAHPLVAATKRELEAANAVDSFHGQLAIALAKRLVTPDESGVSALANQLRVAMAAALGQATPPDPGDGGSGEDDDEVTRARKAREEAREAAGLA